MRLSRRGFVLGGTSAGLLAACGVDGGSNGTDVQLVALFSPDHVIAAGRPQRIPFAVVDTGRLDLADDAEASVTISRDGEPVDAVSVSGHLVRHDHPPRTEPDHTHANLLRYFALRTELAEPGIYDLEVDFGNGVTGTLPVQAFGPDEVDVVLAGERLPPITTPTTDDPGGISPLCTRNPRPCPFHDHDVTDALAAGRPLALLVATPALCQTAYCGPVLETLIETAPGFDHIAFVHLEVYANASEVDGNYADPGLRLAAPVAELGLTFEPSLFLVDAEGVVTDRIDNIFDRSELEAALGTLS